MGPESKARHRSRPWLVDALVVGYLALTALLSLTLQDSGSLLFVHLALIGGVFAIRRWGAEFVHQLYSALLVPCLYLEIDILSGLAGGRTYDHKVMSWEKALFGDPMPATWLSESFPFLLLSEVLHLCYLSFYPMLIFLAIRLFLVSRERLQTYLWCSHSAMLTNYLVQMWFPVQGPRPLLPPLDESLQGPLWQLCHYLCGQGASGAAAFPSGHVTYACAITLGAWHWDQRSYRFLLPVSIGLALATVYGRFHYAVDVLAGAFVGWFFLEYGPEVCETLSKSFSKETKQEVKLSSV